MTNKLMLLSIIAVVLSLLASLAPVPAPVPAFAVTRTFVATLSGGEEVPPTGSTATGKATFTLSDDGSTLTYTITVANINNAVAAHIHLAAPGVNGPVVVSLFGGPLPGLFSGVLAQGTITSANLQSTLLGMPLSALVQQIEAGNAYVNVHTTQNLGGEIRGQVRLSP